MKFSLHWIDEFLDAPPGTDRSRGLLDQAGLPVESVEAGEPGGTGPVFDVEITPNRPDAMSHRGLAREIAALSATPLATPPRELHAPPSSGEPVEALTSVVIQAPRLCRRFGALLIRGVSPAPAPDRVRARLSAIGSHSISAPVDATNYALWSIGQPLHAFDFDKLRGGMIFVRKARRGETLVTLDGIERRLDPADVVVADAERAVSLAGVMGGLETAVTAATRNVLLEAAWWDPVSIRKTARRHGMHTDASHRFERGSDVSAIPEALHLAANLILESAGGNLAPGMLDVRGVPFRVRKTSLRLSRLRLLAGDTRLTLEFAGEALARLGFTVERRPRRVSVEIPFGRHDIRLEDDLVEEVLRVYGYDRLPSRLPPTTIPGRHLEPRRLVEEGLTDAAVASGLYETVGYPFVNPTDEEPFEPWIRASGGSDPLRISNPLDETRPCLRRTLLPELIDAAGGNARRGRREAALFEVGRAFGRADGDPEDPPSLESRRFGFVLSGEARAHWSESARSRPFDFYDAKGLFERLVEPWIAGEDLQWSPAAMPGFAVGACASVETVAGPLGIVGRVAASERERHSLPDASFAAEIWVDRIPTRPRDEAFATWSAFPPIDADLSFAHGPELTWRELREAIRAEDLAHLDALRVTDRWDGPGVPEGRTKTTVRLTFRSGDRTLSQEEVNGERDRLAAALRKRFGVEF